MLTEWFKPLCDGPAHSRATWWMRGSKVSHGCRRALKDDGQPPKGDPDKLADARNAVRALIKLMEDRRADLDKIAEPREVEFTRRTLLNLLAFDRGNREFNRENPMATPVEISQLRDERKGDNLAFLSREYFKGKKIIAWAASSHLLRNPGETESSTAGTTEPIFLSRWATSPPRHSAKTTSSSPSAPTRAGSAGPWSGASPIEKSEAGDLETLMADAGLTLAIIPLNPPAADAGAAWLREPQVMRPMGYGRERAIWGRCFDALFFTREMTPSTSRSSRSSREAGIPRERGHRVPTLHHGSCRGPHRPRCGAPRGGRGRRRAPEGPVTSPISRAAACATNSSVSIPQITTSPPTPTRRRSAPSSAAFHEVGAAFGVMLVPMTVRHRSGHIPHRRGLFRPAPSRFGRLQRRPADARRRDFTINALFLDPMGTPATLPAPLPKISGRLIDHVGGVDDLRAGVIRAVGDPEKRLAEDHLRAIRAVRFAARLGFQLDPHTASAITRHTSTSAASRASASAMSFGACLLIPTAVRPRLCSRRSNWIRPSR